jgi:hypothetical protein
MRTNAMTHPNDVYFNLHSKRWSVVDRDTGRVAKYLDELLVLDVCFVVRQSGVAKTRRERRKNVHAFVRGSVVERTPSVAELAPGLLDGPWTRIRYNPYKHTAFMADESGRERPVTSASVVRLDKDRTVWAVLPQ